MVLFQPFHLPETHEVNTYMIGCPKTKEVLLIDAGSTSPDYATFLEENGAWLSGIFLTHSHWDHTQGLEGILDHHDVPVLSMNGDTRNGRKVNEGDILRIGELEAAVLRTTGHTSDSLSLVLDSRFAFVGDALFAGSIGGTQSAEEMEELRENIRQKIFSLPDEVLVCPGHGPLSTVYIERNYNPFFKF